LRQGSRDQCPPAVECIGAFHLQGMAQCAEPGLRWQYQVTTGHTITLFPSPPKNVHYRNCTFNIPIREKGGPHIFAKQRNNTGTVLRHLFVISYCLQFLQFFSIIHPFKSIRTWVSYVKKVFRMHLIEHLSFITHHGAGLWHC